MAFGECGTIVTAVKTQLESVSRLAFDEKYVWVTVDGERAVHQVDIDTGEIKRTITLAPARGFRPASTSHSKPNR